MLKSTDCCVTYGGGEMSEKTALPEFETDAAWTNPKLGLELRMAILETTRVLACCEYWWVRYGKHEPTAADLLVMTQMILQQKKRAS